jgi:hypothetical protein
MILLQSQRKIETSQPGQGNLTGVTEKLLRLYLYNHLADIQKLPQ